MYALERERGGEGEKGVMVFMVLGLETYPSVLATAFSGVAD